MRVADIVATVISRHFNGDGCEAYTFVRKCIAADGKVHLLVLKDFDLSAWTYNPEDNPWLHLDDDGPPETG